MSALLLLARLVVGATFVWMGAQKVDDPVVFLKLIHEYGILPERPPWILNGVAVALPWLEIVGGALLVLGVAVRGAAALLFALLAAFSAAILARALQVQAAEQIAFCAVAFDCGCGAGVQPICGKLLENGALLLASLLVAWRGGGAGALRPRLLGARTPARAS